MKKKYERPYAEKVEFDYRDSVTACSSFCWWWWCQNNESSACKPNTEEKQQAETQQKGNSNWENKSPYYWGC